MHSDVPYEGKHDHGVSEGGSGGAISTWLETGSSGTAQKKKRKKSKEIDGEKTPQVEFGMTSAEFWEPLAYWQVPRKSEL